MTEPLSRNQEAALAALLQPWTPQLRGVWLVGSRARGDHRAASDIDLVIDGDFQPGDVLDMLVAAEQSDADVRIDIVRRVDLDAAALDAGMLTDAVALDHLILR